MIRADNGEFTNHFDATGEYNFVDVVIMHTARTRSRPECADVASRKRNDAGQGAATRLGPKRTTVNSKMKRLGIDEPGRQAAIDQINESDPLGQTES